MWISSEFVRTRLVPVGVCVCVCAARVFDFRPDVSGFVRVCSVANTPHTTGIRIRPQLVPVRCCPSSKGHAEHTMDDSHAPLPRRTWNAGHAANAGGPRVGNGRGGVVCLHARKHPTPRDALAGVACTAMP